MSMADLCLSESLWITIMQIATTRRLVHETIVYTGYVELLQGGHFPGSYTENRISVSLQFACSLQFRTADFRLRELDNKPNK
jgi:hypothetical protein